MLFNSYIFIFAFLPIVLAGYFFLNRLKKYTLAQAFLVCMSLWFYAYFNPSYIFLLGGSILVNYFFHCMLNKKAEKPVLITGLVLNVGLICYYKYYDFFVENINAAFGSSFALKHILLPLGISFFTLQQISFLIDSYRGETGKYSFVEYALFVSFFPQLIAGPIVTHDEMIPQFRDLSKKKIDPDFLAKGVLIFVLGLTKKVLLADTFGPAVDWGYQHIDLLDSTNAVIISLCYAFQLYFDFSGYCDMAKGLGYMLNITIPTNFNSPYKSVGVIDLWKRWHITLGRFFTRYVYIPLGGNRKGKLRTCLNSFFVFCLSGFWHGANWTYIIWGAMAGIGYIVDYLGRPVFKKFPRFVMIFLTFCFFDLSIVAFRSAGISQMNQMYSVIFSGDFGKIMPEIVSFFNRDELMLFMRFININLLPYAEYYAFIFIGILSFYLCFIGKNAEEMAEKCRFGVVSAVFTAALFLYAVVCLSEVSIFLYFNF